MLTVFDIQGFNEKEINRTNEIVMDQVSFNLARKSKQGLCED